MALNLKLLAYDNFIKYIIRNRPFSLVTLDNFDD